MMIDWQSIVLIFVMLVAAGAIPAAFQISAFNRNANRVRDEMLDLRKALDGRLSELLELTAKASRAEGVESERARDRDA